MKKFWAASVVVAASAFCVGSFGLERDYFAPGQIIVEFEPNVINLPPNPGSRFIAIENVPINDASFEMIAEREGIVTFEVFARRWRHIDRVEEFVVDVRRERAILQPAEVLVLHAKKIFSN